MKSRQTALGILFIFLPIFNLHAQSRPARTPAKKITFVARVCPAFSNVMANDKRAQNIESLEPLGQNTAYAENDPVTIDLEEEVGSQLNCSPLLDWRFGMGVGVSNAKDTTPYGDLSKVGRFLRDTRETRIGVNVLDDKGQPTGERVDGAVTMTLTEAEKSFLDEDELTVQSGVPGDPLIGRTDFAFAALRCGLSNEKGDNVEHVILPNDSKHAFCYLYFVPASTFEVGEIIIRKVVENTATADVPFGFSESISFSGDGSFELKNGESARFSRTVPHSETFQVVENTTDLPLGYDFSRIECSSQNGTVPIITNNVVSFTFTSADRVECNFINRAEDQPPTFDISPILECTARHGAASYTGHFGYYSRAAGIVSVLPGVNNRFLPPPENRGQPYTFRPGHNPEIFTVDHIGIQVEWNLTGNTTTTSSDSIERCKPTCILPPALSMSQCDASVVIDGTLSGTPNNNGTLTGFTWTTNCPATLSNTNTLTPTFTVDFPNVPASGANCNVSLTVVDDTRYGETDEDELQTVACETKATIPACKVDCAGIPNGSTEVDECGVCGGDNSTCLDCAGVPNGGSQVDQCGVCGGNNDSCEDCAGVPNGGAVEDLCGICGGDSSSCRDCAGVPNGGAEPDLCGICGGNNSSCADCNGVPNGGAVVDICGVCGGDGSSCGGCAGTIDQCGVCNGDNSTCRDCAGIPNGGAVVDACGVCGGDGSSCRDCAGVPNGGAAPDQCGVCNGNNSTCLDCNGIPNGGAVADICGVCGGDGSTCGGCAGTIDQCGVCNGDNSTCRDCAGIPNGGTIVDDCGVCGGDGTSCNPTCPIGSVCPDPCPGGTDACGVCGGNNSTCLDCAGLPNGETKVDACGVCGGDGSTCISASGCFERPPVDSQDRKILVRMLADLKLLADNARRYTRDALKCGPSTRFRDNLARINEIVREAKAIIVGDLIKVKNQCANGTCLTVSIDVLKRVLNRLARELRKLSVEGQLNLCRETIESTQRIRDSRMLLADIQNNLGKTDDFATVCVPK